MHPAHRPVPFVRFALLLSALAMSQAGASPAADPGAAAAPVALHGRLRTAGNMIVGADGQPVSLAGVSFGWSQWEAAPYFNAGVVAWLRKDWNCSVVRAPLGVESGGYLEAPEANKARVCAVVDAAIAQGLYVIIDWHDHHAARHLEASEAFFTDMARRYGRYPNVIYEIFNEPLGDASWSAEVKPYAEKVIAAVRAVDGGNLIVVGSPHWSQDVDVAAGDPLRGANIAYTLHFYAGTHKQWLRDKALKALHGGVPLFVTEWGTCNADGAGPVDEESTREWMEFMRVWRLSHCNWAVYDKRETAAIVLPGAPKTGAWASTDLSPSGRLARDWIRRWPAFLGEAPGR